MFERGDRGFGLKAGIDQILGQGAKDAIVVTALTPPNWA
jgi:hypothetical protein